MPAEPDAEAREDHRIELPAIFAAFFWLGVTSFGGNTAAWLYHQIVQRRHWVKDTEFLSDVALGRIVPGSGGVNLTVQVGQRLRGGTDAAASVVGLLSGPLVIVLALAAAYTRIGWSPAVHAVLDGIAAAAIGLTFRHRRQAAAERLGAGRPAFGHAGDRALRRRAALADAACGSRSRPDQHRPGIGAGPQCLTISGHCWRWSSFSFHCHCFQSAAVRRCWPIWSTSRSPFTAGPQRGNSPISSRYRARHQGPDRCSRP